MTEPDDRQPAPVIPLPAVAVADSGQAPDGTGGADDPNVADDPDVAAAHSWVADELDLDEADRSRRDWAWVEEWRAGSEGVPWSHGLALAAFFALLAGCAIFVLCAGLSASILLTVIVNVLVALGLAPAIWLSTRLPLLRWIAGGVAVGMVLGWIGVLAGG